MLSTISHVQVILNDISNLQQGPLLHVAQSEQDLSLTETCVCTTSELSWHESLYMYRTAAHKKPYQANLNHDMLKKQKDTTKMYSGIAWQDTAVPKPKLAIYWYLQHSTLNGCLIQIKVPLVWRRPCCYPSGHSLLHSLHCFLCCLSGAAAERRHTTVSSSEWRMMVMRQSGHYMVHWQGISMCALLHS